MTLMTAKNAKRDCARPKKDSSFANRLARKTLKDTSGNVAIITSLVLSVIIVSVGGALDFSTIFKTTVSAQDAADAAVLAGVLAKGTLEEKTVVAKSTFVQNSTKIKKNANTFSILSDGFYDIGDGSFEYTAKVQYKPFFLHMIGMKEVEIDVRAVAGSDATDIDIVFVLDSSGSMATSDGTTTRMAELKSSVKLFLSDFENRGSVKAALVPFDTQVKLENAWMNNGTTSVQQNPYEPGGSCASIADPIDRQACQDAQPAQFADCSKINNHIRVDDAFDFEMCARQGDGFRFDSTGAYAEALADSYQYVATTDGDRHRIWRNVGDKCTVVHNRNTAECVGFVPDSNGQYIYDEPAPAPSGPAPTETKDNDETTPNNDLLVEEFESWSGCVIDRTQDHDVSATAPTLSEPETLYPRAHCALDSLKSIEPLTNDLEKLARDVDQMRPNGNTNLTIGVQWGMEAFTPRPPLRGARRGDKAKKIMILLTDGENTQNRWWGSDRSADINARARLACDNAKALGAEIFSVRLIGGNESLLQYCAEDMGHYHNVVKASELSGVLGQISKDIKQIRLTH